MAQDLKVPVQLVRLLKLDVGRQVQVHRYAVASSGTRHDNPVGAVLLVLLHFSLVAGGHRCRRNLLEQLLFLEYLVKLQSLPGIERAPCSAESVDYRFDQLAVMEEVTLEPSQIDVELGQLFQHLAKL